MLKDSKQLINKEPNMPPLHEVKVDIACLMHHQHSRSGREETPASLEDSISLSSEISLDLLVKPQRCEDDKVTAPSGDSSSIPEDLDYSLSVLLPAKEDEDEDDDISQEELSPLDQSDYSLKVNLSKDTPLNNLNMSRSSLSLDFHNSRSTTASQTLHNGPKNADKVKFNPRIQVRKVSDRKSLPKGELKARWYTRKEFKEIRQVCFDTLKMAKRDEPIIEDEGFCIRGLEYKLKDAYKDRQANKASIRHLVIEEQDFQKDADIYDPDLIAHISEDTSRHCVLLAIEQAKIDEQESLEYLSS